MFKVRASRREQGGYDLSFGKGGNKLTAIMQYGNGADRWTIVKFDGEWAMKREALAAWGKWAAANYRGSGVAPTPSQPDAKGESPAGDVDPDAAAAHSPHADDELHENVRLFFDTLSKHRGELTEWQRAQARSVLREIGWPGRNDKDKCPLCGRGINAPRPSHSGCSVGQSCSTAASGPPAYKAQAQAGDSPADADVVEPAVPAGEPSDPADGPVESTAGEVTADTAA